MDVTKCGGAWYFDISWHYQNIMIISKYRFWYHHMIRISYVNSTDYSYSSSTSCFWSLLACLRGVSCEVLCFCHLPCDECLAFRSLYDRSHYRLKKIRIKRTVYDHISSATLFKKKDFTDICISQLLWYFDISKYHNIKNSRL